MFDRWTAFVAEQIGTDHKAKSPPKKQDPETESEVETENATEKEKHRF